MARLRLRAGLRPASPMAATLARIHRWWIEVSLVKNVNRCPLTCEHGVVDTSIWSGSGGHLFNAIVQPDQIEVRFDGERLVADAGLLLPATLAVGLGRRELVDELVDLGDTPGRANAGDKAMTLVASALAGAAGSTTATGCAPGRPGRSWATGSSPIHDRQVPALVHLGPRPASWTGSPPRRWGGPGPGRGRGRTPSLWTPRSGRSMGWPSRASPSATQGPRLPPAAGVRRRHRRPAPCPAARRQRQHRAGAAGCITETINRVRAAGATGPLTLRADSGFSAPQVVKVCQQAGCAPRSPPSATRGPQGDPADPRRRLGADRLLAGGRAAVAETSYRPFGKRGPAVRLIVRRVRPTRARSWRWT